jgi:glutathione S-transferase
VSFSGYEDFVNGLIMRAKWLGGDNISIADIAVAAPMHVRQWQRLPLNDHPDLKRWMADVEQLPCWQKTQSAVERALRLE